jgi:uncharacterized protein YeeX (DUF496 family)
LQADDLDEKFTEKLLHDRKHREELLEILQKFQHILTDGIDGTLKNHIQLVMTDLEKRLDEYIQQLKHQPTKIIVAGNKNCVQPQCVQL